MLDKIDKAILRLLVKYKDQTLTVNQIAKKVVISPRTEKKHIVKIEEDMNKIKNGNCPAFEK